jgi:sugar lactone lactonase YvrE/DNA-binding IclR family transcriptional regulator
MKSAKFEFIRTAREVLKAIEVGPSPLAVTAIAQSLSLTPESVERTVTSLAGLGLIRFDSTAPGYVLGAHLFEDARNSNDDLDLLRDAADGMAQLREISGEKVILARMDGAETVYFDALDGSDQRNESVRPARRIPFWQSAGGKALAACLDRDARKSIMQGAANPSALSAELDLIHARGYAIEVEVKNAGPCGVSAPIFDRRGRVIAAIGIEGECSRLSRAQLHELGPAVVEATRNASLRAGGAPRPNSKSPRPAAPVSPAITLLADVRNIIGECPVFDAANERLFWVDMYDPSIWRFDFRRGKVVSFHPGEMVTALALAPEGMLAAAQSNLWLIDPETGDRIRSLGHPEADIPGNRFNDAKCDSSGRFWVNTMDYSFARNAGSLYRLDGDGDFRTMDAGLNVPNGMGWSPDNRTMYLADTADRVIYAYDFREDSGDISNRRIFVRIPDDVRGAPDGLAVDANGNLWVAMFDGWRVSQYAPDGILIDEILMPVPRPTSCAFGGKDGKTLFVTSARIRISDAMLLEAPNAGAVFAVSV